LRAITKRPENRDSAVMISSTIPSAKYSCSGSPPMLVKGKTAMDGLSGGVRSESVPPRGAAADAGWVSGALSGDSRETGATN
jgi:hypothetical protein